MYFDSLTHLLHMDGHGIYVWGAYAIGLVVVFYNIIVPILQRRRIFRQISSQQRHFTSSRQFQVDKKPLTEAIAREGDVL